MLRARTTRACFGLLLALSVVSCSDDSSDDDGTLPDGNVPGPGSDAGNDAGRDAGPGPNIDASTDAGGTLIDAAVDANVADGGNKALVSCLERPGLPTPPTGTLPCELIPPGVTLSL